jgi:hypothetical protein
MLEVPVDLHIQGAARVDVDNPAARIRAIEGARTEDMPRIAFA